MNCGAALKKPPGVFSKDRNTYNLRSTPCFSMVNSEAVKKNISLLQQTSFSKPILTQNIKSKTSVFEIRSNTCQ